jgi:hypothetical protein
MEAPTSPRKPFSRTSLIFLLVVARWTRRLTNYILGWNYSKSLPVSAECRMYNYLFPTGKADPAG